MRRRQGHQALNAENVWAGTVLYGVLELELTVLFFRYRGADTG
jgi:hypothetical protein